MALRDRLLMPHGDPQCLWPQMFLITSGAPTSVDEKPPPGSEEELCAVLRQQRLLEDATALATSLGASSGALEVKMK